jgi:hypothetical protein
MFLCNNLTLAYQLFTTLILIRSAHQSIGTSGNDQNFVNQVCKIIVEHLNVNQFENVVTFPHSFIQQWIRHLDCHFGDNFMEYLSQEWVTNTLHYKDIIYDVTLAWHAVKNLTLRTGWRKLQPSVMFAESEDVDFCLYIWNLTNMLKSYVLLLMKK